MDLLQVYYTILYYTILYYYYYYLCGMLLGRFWVALP